MNQFLYTLVTYQEVAEILTYGVTLVILIVSIDDLFIDCWYWLRELYRWYWITAQYPALKVEALEAKVERPIAIMVPAWKENDVIQAMLRTNYKSLRYKDYHFFVGVYQNDPETIAEVTAAAAGVPNITMAVVPRDGPTSKADCLNVVMAQIVAHERKTEKGFVGIALHDSEDVIHTNCGCSTICSTGWTSFSCRSIRFSATLTNSSPGPIWTNSPSGIPRISSFARA